MIVRIVKMHFRKDNLDEFLENFNQHKQQIRSFPGCRKLELLQEKTRKNVYFTYSWWSSEEDLENYRQSDLFQGVWKTTKALFAEKAEAWSLISKEEL